MLREKRMAFQCKALMIPDSTVIKLSTFGLTCAIATCDVSLKQRQLKLEEGLRP